MTHYQLVAQNKRRSWYVVIGFVLFVTAAAVALRHLIGLEVSLLGPALIISGLTSLGSYWFSDKLVLKMTGAKPANREQHFDFYTLTENLCIGQNLPMPKLYVLDTPALNAFATGRDHQHAVVCCTTGLLSKLDRAELEGVIAHELSHIKNYDMRLMSIVTVLVGTLATTIEWVMRSRLYGIGGSDSRERKSHPALMIAGFALIILAPLIGKMLQLAISRKREFLADASAVAMTQNPQGMIDALEKISHSPTPVQSASAATAHLFISDPQKSAWSAKAASLFRTHPPMTERIAALKSIM